MVNRDQENSRGHIWLRAETKPQERRTALTPRIANQLVKAGYQLTVEASHQSAFPASMYENSGCQVAKQGDWQAAPENAIVVGLKELDRAESPIRHRHVHFAHVYKNQSGWENVLRRFDRGGGELYDLEYLVDDNGRRVAAFGRWAGFAGAALSVLGWAGQQTGAEPILENVQPRGSEQDLGADVRKALEACDSLPTAMVIGALGRSGRGAVEFFESVGIHVTKWDLEETKSGGPFPQTLEHNILVNCVFVQSEIPPFITRELLESPDRQLRLICDVSCDPYGDYNPLPIYDRCTSFSDPTLRIVAGDRPLDLIAIDHLPSLLPVESSEDFAEQLLPSLLQLDALDDGVWKRSLNVFREKTKLATRDG